MHLVDAGAACAPISPHVSLHLPTSPYISPHLPCISWTQELLARGFGHWSKKDLNAFVRGCELHGRNDLVAVAGEVEGKSEKEVAKGP